MKKSYIDGLPPTGARLEMKEQILRFTRHYFLPDEIYDFEHYPGYYYQLVTLVGKYK